MTTSKRFNLSRLWISTLTILLFVLFMTGKKCAAENEPVGGFNYEVVFPENQKDLDIGYFRLDEKEGNRQKIQLTLSNPMTKEVQVEVDINGAKTNSNGVIEYGVTDIKNDKSLKFDFKDLVKGPSQVILGGGETKTLELEIAMPETHYDGIIAGGVQLMKKNEIQNEHGSGSLVVNRYAFVIPILLEEGNVDQKPELQFNNVTPTQVNGSNAITVNLSNIIPVYLDDLTLEVQVYKKGTQNVLYESKKNNMRMAPNSFIDYVVNLNGEKMIAGDFTANITAKSKDNQWEWKKDFTITKKQADKFNDNDVNLIQEKGIDWKIILTMLIISLIVIFIIVCSVIILKRKNNRKSSSKKKIEKQVKKIKPKKVQRGKKK